MTGEVGWIYLLCFDEPFGHARHYLGWARKRRLRLRLSSHAAGHGARLTEVVREAGIGWTLTRTWEGTRDRERRLKNRGGSTRHCPRCGAKVKGRKFVTALRFAVLANPERQQAYRAAKAVLVAEAEAVVAAVTRQDESLPV